MNKKFDVDLTIEFKVDSTSESHAEIGVLALLDEIKSLVMSYGFEEPTKLEYVIEPIPEYQELLFDSLEEE